MTFIIIFYCYLYYCHRCCCCYCYWDCCSCCYCCCHRHVFIACRSWKYEKTLFTICHRHRHRWHQCRRHRYANYNNKIRLSPTQCTICSIYLLLPSKSSSKIYKNIVIVTYRASRITKPSFLKLTVFSHIGYKRIHMFHMFNRRSTSSKFVLPFVLEFI